MNLKLKSQSMFVVIIFLLLTSNVIMFRDYKLTKSNHNAVTWNLIRLTRVSMKDLAQINNINDTNTIYKKIVEVRNNLLLLELNLRDSTFTRESIDKKKLYDFVNRLFNVCNLLENRKSTLENDHLKDKLIVLANLFNEVQGGYGKPNLLGVNRVIVIYDKSTWNKIEAMLLEIEKEIDSR
ncbi:hypothetical protein R9X47_00520 [Wukongibacter baidiensis]|uniref:hypothetical protein n=1 Tax=Wukongibacter baidiensis TaxID=1723361 RepID=UPI003D7F8963